MALSELIFSNETGWRISRHVAFWLAWFVMSFVTSPVGVLHTHTLSTFIAVDILFVTGRILAQIPFCYIVLYIIIPRFFQQGKYTLSFLVFCLSMIAAHWLRYFTLFLSEPIIVPMLDLSNGPVSLHRIALSNTLDFSGPLAVFCLMGSLKFLKKWYVKQKENITLKRENVRAELQVLKAQVHPHFLFNTLNNIYAFTLTKSPIAAELLEKLYGILHYMIIEGQEASVPLRKEIRLLEDYISLEKVRYGDRLKINVNISGDLDNQFIAPLLMIPFVENSFKHGSSRMLSQPTVSLIISVERNTLNFTLVNNKPATNTQQKSDTLKGGIGLKNTSKRLQLLYPGKHNLDIDSNETMFTVKMTLQLESFTPGHTEAVNVLPNNPIAYANA